MHGNTFTVKDRRGIEHTCHGPTGRIPDKVIDVIEGRVRYFLRCYLKAEEQKDGTLLKKRYLSLIPKENEFGIARGIDETKVPQDIELDFDIFAKIIGLDMEVKETPKLNSNVQIPTSIEEESTVKEESEQNVSDSETSVRSRRRRKTIEVEKSEEIVKEDNSNEVQETTEVIQSSINEHVKMIPVDDVIEKKEEPVVEEKSSEPEQTQVINGFKVDDIKASIRARILAAKQQTK